MATLRDPFRPVTPGLEARISRWLVPGYLAGVGLPALTALWVNLRMPPGPPEFALDKWRQIIDAMALGMAMFDAMAMFAVALGCLIVTLMKSRPRQADVGPGPDGN